VLARSIAEPTRNRSSLSCGVPRRAGVHRRRPPLFVFSSKEVSVVKQIKINLNQRAVLVRDGLAVKALGPGRYTLWKQYDVVMFDVDKLAFTAPNAVLGALPAEWFSGSDRSCRPWPADHRSRR
jgi:hypothetical protein